MINAVGNTIEGLSTNIATSNALTVTIKAPFSIASAALDITLSFKAELDSSGNKIWAATFAGTKFVLSQADEGGIVLGVTAFAEAALAAAGLTLASVPGLAIGIGIGAAYVSTAIWDSAAADAGLKELLSNPREFFGTDIPNAITDIYQKSIELNNGTPYTYTDFLMNAAFPPLFFRGLFMPLNNNINPGGGSTSGKDSVADSIVSQLGTQGILIDREALERINGAFADADFDIGGLVHIPTSISTVITFPAGTPPSGTLSIPPAGQTLVLDMGSGNVYTVGSSLDGHDDGALIIENNGTALTTLAKGSYNGANYQPWAGFLLAA
jgi:hypothetical protein